MKLNLIIILLLLSPLSFAKKRKKVKYEYKKFERFDFDALDVEGSRSSPGDLSIGQRLKRKQRNKLPERKNFNREMKRALDSIL